MGTPATNRIGAARFQPALSREESISPAARRCRKRFLRFFPAGFRDDTYLDWERNYKWDAHERWCALLRRASFRSLLDAGDYETIARHAVAIESRTNLLFSFEKMALRDAVKSREGARAFAEGLWTFLCGSGNPQARFENWCEVVAGLPRRQTCVFTWPMVTIWGFIAQPENHFFLKPVVTRRSAEEYGCELSYASRPNWATYQSVIEFAEQVREDQNDLHPRDLIDLQSFIWVQGSDEYEE